MKKLIIIYGSANDKEFMEPGRQYLEENSIPYEEKVLSVHRNFDELIAELEAINETGETGAIIAVAGLSAALPGVVAVRTDVPVIGVPVPCGPLQGIDALLSVIQVPGGVPLASVGLHSKAPLNACQFAHKILKVSAV